jgi:hypothetical protein
MNATLRAAVLAVALLAGPPLAAAPARTATEPAALKAPVDAETLKVGGKSAGKLTPIHVGWGSDVTYPERYRTPVILIVVLAPLLAATWLVAQALARRRRRRAGPPLSGR